MRYLARVTFVLVMLLLVGRPLQSHAFAPTNLKAALIGASSQGAGGFTNESRSLAPTSGLL